MRLKMDPRVSLRPTTTRMVEATLACCMPQATERRRDRRGRRRGYGAGWIYQGSCRARVNGRAIAGGMPQDQAGACGGGERGDAGHD